METIEKYLPKHLRSSNKNHVKLKIQSLTIDPKSNQQRHHLLQSFLPFAYHTSPNK